jgi:hypothetical protein
MNPTCGACSRVETTWASYLARGVYEPAFRDGDEETDLPVFSPSMYPKGVNGDFHNCASLEPDAFMSNLKNRLENSELRDVARNYDQVMELMRDTGLTDGASVLDVGAGTGNFRMTHCILFIYWPYRPARRCSTCIHKFVFRLIFGGVILRSGSTW